MHVDEREVNGKGFLSSDPDAGGRERRFKPSRCLPELQPPIPRRPYEPGLGPASRSTGALQFPYTGGAGYKPFPSSCGAMATAWTASRRRSRRHL